MLICYIGDKTLDPSFNGSTEQLMKEMPLELYEEATQNENDGDYMSDEGFQVFGDNDGVIELQYSLYYFLFI